MLFLSVCLLAVVASATVSHGQLVLDTDLQTAGSSSTVRASPLQTKSLLQTLEPQDLPDGEWHMEPVRAIHARVQSDPPVLHPSNLQFISSVGGADFAKSYTAGMDGVNTASVEGALMYVQAEGINYNTRSEEQRCQRKNDMKFVVFYEVVIAQTNETLALYQDTADQNEYGPMVPMDQGRCSPTGLKRGQDVLPKECYYFNGDDGEPNVGPFVGGESKELDVRAPYPHNLWFSLPHTCPLKVWAEKTPECRAKSRRGLCEVGVLPDGVRCTFAYSILGYIAIDDVVGITSMANRSTGQQYADFAAFCKDGGVEFKATIDGEWEESIAFWLEPQSEEANAWRAQQLIDAYQNLTTGVSESTQIDTSLVQFMRPLPAVAAMARENPPCYLNVKKCSVAACRRETYSQVCKVCESAGDDGCVEAPQGFAFPKLKKAVGDDGGEGDADPAVQREPRKRTQQPAKMENMGTRLYYGGAVSAVVSVVVATWML